MNKRLLILGCSATKQTCPGLLPAIDRYDGQAYRVLKNFLRNHQWSSNVSIGVLSAKYGLFGALKGIEYYDTEMSRSLALEKSPQCCAILKKWADEHDSIHLSLGQTYLPAVQPALDALNHKVEIFEGGIGTKSRKLKHFLESTSTGSREKAPSVEGGTGKRSYFLPDWDDLLDPNFNFETDTFSGENREERGDEHFCVLMKPERICDGILLSLAQQGASKGPLKRLGGTETSALSPVSLRKKYALGDNQRLFGDCGAFSYVSEDEPTISVEQAVALYDLYGFDFGASVDHIPVQKFNKNGALSTLSEEERQARVDLTRANAERFIKITKKRKAQFNPVGTIQALTPELYAKSVRDYYNLGYRHLALGGLVPLSNSEIEKIVKEVITTADELKERPWIHLFGIFRPKLQDLFRELKIDSFDSATYFRKAWLRSDRNYLGKNGKWYAALRVPMTSDGRTRKRLESADVDMDQLRRKEREVLRQLCLYDKDQANINEVLDMILDYDQHLTRANVTPQSTRARYRRTLEDRPWQMCKCPFCQALGIHILIFRGSNRNRRRGAHNTLMLYGQI